MAAAVDGSRVANMHPLEDEVLTDEDLTELTKKKFDYIRFTFADINCVSRSRTVPKEHVADFLRKGVALFVGCVAYGPRSEISLLKEVKDNNFSNAYVRPMPGTLHFLPWATSPADSRYRVGELLCETFWIPPYRDGGHQVACPRYMARRQLGRLFDLGFELYSAFEAEFCVFEKDAVTPVFSGVDSNSSLLMDRHGEYLYDMERGLRESGVDVAVLHTEHGQGQFEMVLQPSNGIVSADRMFSLKDGVKAMSRHHLGRVATFMTRPNPKAADCLSAMHFNHSLWSTQSQTRFNKFHDPNDPDGLSVVARHWLAGLVKHSRALTAICSPTLTCYRRQLNPFIPSKGNWGIDDRTVAFRVKNLGPSETYVENRLASSAANPYLVLAGTVAAGIDGIVNRLECPAPVGRAEEKEQGVGKVLPESLEEALICLEEDEVMKEALGEEFIRWFTTIKRNCEVDRMKGIDLDSQEAHDLERALYFEFV